MTHALATSVASTSLSAHWLGREVQIGEQRGVVPNGLVRSAVFSSLPPNAKRKVYTERTALASWAGDSVYQIGGCQLSQSEMSVWLEMVRRALPSAVDTQEHNKVRVTFTAAEMLRALGRPVDSPRRQDLRKLILTLGRARFQVTLGVGRCYEGNLLDLEHGDIAGEDGYLVWLDVKLSRLFLMGWSFLDLEQRKSLARNPLAQWLHSFYSTHRDPKPISERKLKVLADRSAMRDADWHKALMTALTVLRECTGWRGTLAANGVVRMNKHDNSPLVRLSKADTRLLDAWLVSLSRDEVIARTEQQGVMVYLSFAASIVQLRESLKTLLLARPGRITALLEELRAAEEEEEEDI